LKLETKSYPHTYTICCIKKDHYIKVTDLCHVPISIDKLYQDFIACDVADMEACYILLGRPWQHDVDATHRGKENIYMFPWKGKEAAMRPIPPAPKTKKEEKSKLIFMQFFVEPKK